MVVLAILVAGCAAPPISAEEIRLVQSPTPAADHKADLTKYEVNLIEQYREELAKFTDATRYFIALEIGETPTNISGKMEVLYTNTESEALHEIYFRLFPNVGGKYLKVENVSVNDQPMEGVLEFEDTALRVDLPQPLLPGQSTSIHMDFYQTVPTQMGGNYGLYIFLDDILALDAFFPIIPVFNEEGWNVESPPRNADMIFADAAIFEVQVSAPSGLVLAASGVQVDSEVKSGRQEVTFVAGPQRDFYIAACPRFVSESLNVGGTLVTSYFPEEYREMGTLVLTTAVQALIIFSEEYGVYPYAELDLVSTPMQAGGMEYSGAAAMALYLYEPGVSFGALSGRDFLESATAHEVAHQWFFNQVMNDQMDEPWLDEAFAQYLTSVYYRGVYGESAADSYKDAWKSRWARINSAEIPIGLPAGAYDAEQYSSIIYGRAPIFIAEIEKLMGSDTFNEFLSEYVDTFRWQEVNTRDFLKLAEQTCDCGLDAMVEEYGVIQ
mgnify:CR=1 FL=1